MSATVLSFPQTGEARLRLALKSLDTALGGQRAAAEEWAQAAAELRGSVRALHDSLRTYDAELGRVSNGLDTLAGENRKLQRWAETAGPG